MLTANQIAFAYHQAPVVSEISLTIAPGQFVGLLGPNGSGKSTLLQILAGLLTPQQGTIIYNGTALSVLPRQTRARQIAYVPQETQITFPLRVREVVALGRLPYLSGFGWEQPEDHTVVTEALAVMELTALADRPLATLSGGERQRVFLARALAQSPTVLICDEPTTHLDLRHQLECMELLARCRTVQGMTVIAALHDLPLAAHYCDRVGLLCQGHLHSYGSTKEILTEDAIREVFGVQHYHLTPCCRL